MNDMKMGMLPTEQASLEDVMVDGVERYENSILSNVPSGLADKGILAVRLFHYFLDSETKNMWTGKPTMLDLEESYIMSGVYPEKHLETVYKVWLEPQEVRRKDGSTVTEYETKYAILNRKEDMRIRTEARKYWNENGLDQFFLEAQQYKRGNIPFIDQLKFAIETDALKPGDTANRKMAMDIHGMKNKFGQAQINVYVDGGGKHLARTIIESSGNDNFNLGIPEDE
jgi:hypothetical protein